MGAEEALEGSLRGRLETLGIQQAPNLAPTAIDRRCVEAIHMVLTDEDGTPNFVHAGFAMTALPHKRIEAKEWVRDGADIRLRIESGKTHDGTAVGVPFGSTSLAELPVTGDESGLAGTHADRGQAADPAG